MDLTDLANKLGLSESKQLVRKAAELRRLSDIQFNSSVIGVGETCKAIICLEIAATGAQVIFDLKSALKLSGMSEKAYNRSLIAMQNGLGVNLDVLGSFLWYKKAYPSFITQKKHAYEEWKSTVIVSNNHIKVKGGSAK